MKNKLVKRNWFGQQAATAGILSNVSGPNLVHNKIQFQISNCILLLSFQSNTIVPVIDTSVF